MQDQVALGRLWGGIRALQAMVRLETAFGSGQVPAGEFFAEHLVRDIQQMGQQAGEVAYGSSSSPEVVMLAGLITQYAADYETLRSTAATADGTAHARQMATQHAVQVGQRLNSLVPPTAPNADLPQ